MAASNPKMRVIIPCIVLLVVSLSIMFFYGNSVSDTHGDSSHSDIVSTSSRGVSEPYVLSMPPGNCNCSVLYTQNFANPLQAATPSLYCQCVDTSTTLGAPEVQVVEKEVIKEVVKEVECPVCETTQVAEKEVIKDEKQEECPPVPWYAKDRNWHYPATLPLCSMDVCFDYSRCDDAEELLIYTYYKPLAPPRYFSRINETKYHTDDPAKACLFLVPFDNYDPWTFQKIKKLPYWNGGMNHLVLTFSDKYGRLAPRGDDLGNASILATDLQETMRRSGFDISIPLPAHYRIHEYQSVNALDRKYLATFRGLRYIGFTDDGVFRSSKEFRGMHNGKDVIVATTCEHQTNSFHRKNHPELGADCEEDKALYALYNFIDLMNTTFALVPAGRQPASYRFTEVLSAGAIPVLIADNYVKPFDTLIPWHKCVIQFPTTEMHRIVKTLRAVKDEEKVTRQRNCLQIYEEFLKDDDTLLRSTIRSLKARFLGAFPNLTEL